MRLALALGSDEGWIDIKERLKVKDERNLLGFSVNGFEADGTPRVRVENNAVAKAAVRIVAWSLPGVKPFPVAGTFEAKIAAVDDLYTETFQVIAAALFKFEQDQAAEKTAKEDAETTNPTPDGASA